MRKTLVCVLAFCVLVPVQAVAELARYDVERLKQQIWQIRSEFHMLTIMEGHQDYEMALQRSVQQADREISDVINELRGNDDDVVSDLNLWWSELKQAANEMVAASGGATDGFVLRSVNERPYDLVNILASLDAAEDGEYDDLAGVAALLQHMTSEYLNLSSNPFGGMAAGSDTYRLDFTEAVPEFEQRLASAMENHRDDPNIIRSLEQVETKWRFMRESMIRFFENSVPFLIYRYTDQIVSTLNQVVDLQQPDDMPAMPTFAPVPDA